MVRKITAGFVGAFLVAAVFGISALKAGAETRNVLNFKGGCIVVPNSDDLNLGTSDFTFEAWVKKDSYKEWATIYRKGAYKLGYNFALTQEGNLNLYLGDGEGSSRGCRHGITDTGWHHMVITGKRNDLAVFYCDGRIIGSGDIDQVSGPVTNTVDLTIGRISKGGGDIFLGYIKDARFYKAALTKEEVLDNFAGKVTRRGLVSWWKMDEGDGKIIRDSVGKNDGMLEGDVVWERTQ